MKRRSGRWLLLGVALVPASVKGQQPAPADTSQPAQDSPTRFEPDLTTRYRFIERYTTDQARATDGTIGQYRAAFRDVQTHLVDNGRGSPTKDESVTQMVFRERPAEVSSLDSRRVLSSVRQYDGVRFSPVDDQASVKPPLFDSLRLYYRVRIDQPPILISLTPGHELRDLEYGHARYHPFIPDLAFVLPDLPERVGDEWPIQRVAAETLLGEAVLQVNMKAKLLEVKNLPDGIHKQAIIDVTGRPVLDMGDGQGVPANAHAQFQFTFIPRLPEDEPGKPRDDQAAVDAVGGITRVSFAEEVVVNLPPPDDRLRDTYRRSLVLERSLTDLGVLLDLPDSPPKATVENSWLSYVDPAGRFQWKHPQDLILEQAPEDADEAGLERAVFVRHQAEGNEVVMINLVPETGFDVDAIRKGKMAMLQDDGNQVIPGKAGWLPEAEWGGKRVYKFEFLVNQNMHRIGYIIETGRTDGLFVEAMSTTQNLSSFRQEVEGMIRTIRLEPPPGRRSSDTSRSTDARPGLPRGVTPNESLETSIGSPPPPDSVFVPAPAGRPRSSSARQQPVRGRRPGGR